MHLPIEGQRTAFITQRDGIQAAIAFVEQTHQLYRRSLKHGMAKGSSHYHKTYLLSCVDFRKFLMVHGVYAKILTKIKYS